MEAIRIEGLCRSFSGHFAVDELSLTVHRGELLALLGLNGAGKTTTVRMLSGLLRPDRGDAFLEGRSILRNTQDVKRIIGVSPQESATAPNLTVYENLELIARLHGLDREATRAKISELEATFSLGEVRNKKSKHLSGGWQRRLSIAMALVNDPKILFLDEPTLGLDVLARRELWRFIERLRGRVTVVLTTHYMEEAEALADRIAMMKDGRLYAHGTVGELKEQTGSVTLEEAFIKLAGEGSV